jgi:hypothetical protein
MSEIKVNKISPKQTCTQLTLGDSGDTIIIPAGATITNNGTATGFGATGAVNWDTTPKTTTVTAVSGVGYFVNTTSGAITVNLPATPSAGAIVGIADYAGTAAANNITIGRNGSNIEGLAVNGSIYVNRDSTTLVYVDGTQGWVPISDNVGSTIFPGYVAATGGTITTCGNFKTHVFTGPGTFTVTCAGNAAGANTVEYLVRPIILNVLETMGAKLKYPILPSTSCNFSIISIIIETPILLTTLVPAMLIKNLCWPPLIFS